MTIQKPNISEKRKHLESRVVIGVETFVIAEN